MKRKILAFLLTLCMVLGMVPVTAFAEDGDNAINVDPEEQIQEGEEVAEEVTSPDDLGMEEKTTPNAIVSKLDSMVLKPQEHSYMCWPSGETTINRPLDIVMNFKANDTLEQARTGDYGDWICDFYVTVSEMTNDTITTDDCYLAGNYGNFGWIVIPMDEMEIENGVSYPVVAAYDANLTYENICDYVKNFTAAIHISDKIINENP
ncbi:MAG: hypothetical protein IKY08_07775, partial [Firmicutes bacterium]|nr:hypothetical protein [Bacillota bacterium]